MAILMAAELCRLLSDARAYDADSCSAVCEFFRIKMRQLNNEVSAFHALYRIHSTAKQFSGVPLLIFIVKSSWV